MMRVLLLKPIVAVAVLAGAALPAVANASVVEQITMQFASGGTFVGDVTFADDFSSYTAVTGTLSGGSYGTDPISWVWDTNNWSSGTANFSNWLMDGSSGGGYTHWIQFAYNYSNAPTLSFTSGVSYAGKDNYVDYSDPLIGGSIGSAPEPATWAMMGLGFAALGLAGWRGRRAATAVAL